MKIADAQASPVIAASKYWTTYNTNQAKIQAANQTGVTAKNNAQAAKAQNAGSTIAKPVVGFDPQSGERVITTADDAESRGLQQTLPVKTADVHKYRTANAQFGNVQAAKSKYLMAAQTKAVSAEAFTS